MSQFDSMYERTIRKLLKGHVESGVPSERDLWPAIRERLSSPSNRGNQISELDAHEARPTPVSVRPTSRLAAAMKLAMGLVGLALLTGLTVLSISGLAQRSNKATDQTATPLPNAVRHYYDDEATYLFSTSTGTGQFLPSLAGFSVGNDGTFWIMGQDKVLRHYSQTGDDLGSLDLKARIEEARSSDGMPPSKAGATIL